MKFLTIHILCILVTFSVQAQTWQPIGPYGGNLNVVSAHPTDANIVLVGTNMGVYRSLDAGETWQATSTTGTINAIAFAPDNPDVVYAGGQNLYKSTDGGGIWEQVSLAFGDVRSLALSDSLTVYVGSDSGLFFNPGGGPLWGWAGLDGQVQAIEIDPTEPNTIYVATVSKDESAANIHKTTDGGEHWTVSLDSSLLETNIQDFSCLAIAPHDSKIIYAGGGGDNVYKSTDAGKSWNRVFGTSSENRIRTIVISPGEDTRIYTGHDHSGYWSEDGGTTWTEWTIGGTEIHNLVISPSKARTLYAATGSGFYKSHDSGVSWTRHSTGLPGIHTYSLAVDSLNEGTIYAGAAGLSVMKTVDGGSTWQQAAFLAPHMWTLVFSPRDPNVLYAGGSSLCRSVDGAQSWECFQGGQVYSIAFAPSNTRIAYATSFDGHSIYKSIDGGRFWNVIPAPGWYAADIIVDAVDSELVYAIMWTWEGEVEWMRRSTDGGFTWKNIYQFGGSSAVDPQVSGTVYLASGDIKISTDAGDTWKTFAFADRDDMQRIVFDPKNPQILYASNREEVYQSTDKGQTWKDIGTLGAHIINSIHPDPHINGRVYVATEAGIYVNSTGATDIVPPNPPSGLQVSAANGAAKLAWNANPEEDIAGYQIRYGTAEQSYPGRVDVGNVTTYTLTHLTAPYYFLTVVAYDTAHNYSLPSDAVEAYFPENESPTQPNQPGSFPLQLSAGLHMISLPLKPARSMNARSFAEMLGASLVVQYDEDADRFSTYIPVVATIDGFTIKGGHGYIVNLKKAKEITFTGTAWSAAPTKTQSDLTDPLWAFAVGGILPQGTEANQLILLNPRNGWHARAESQGAGRFGAVLVGAEGEAVVALGDTLEIYWGEQVMARHHVTTPDLRLAYGIVELVEQLPSQTRLLPNYPNPFNPETWIPYQLAKSTGVTMRIYDVQGRLVQEFALGYQPAGVYASKAHAVHWDGVNSQGERVSNGIYFYQLNTGNQSTIRRMAVVK